MTYFHESSLSAQSKNASLIHLNQNSDLRPVSDQFEVGRTQNYLSTCPPHHMLKRIKEFTRWTCSKPQLLEIGEDF